MGEQEQKFRPTERVKEVVNAARNNLVLLEMLSGSPELSYDRLRREADPAKLIKDKIPSGPGGLTRSDLAVAAHIGLNFGVMIGIEYALSNDNPGMGIVGLVQRSNELVRRVREMNGEVEV